MLRPYWISFCNILLCKCCCLLNAVRCTVCSSHFPCWITSQPDPPGVQVCLLVLQLSPYYSYLRIKLLKCGLKKQHSYFLRRQVKRIQRLVCSADVMAQLQLLFSVQSIERKLMLVQQDTYSFYVKQKKNVMINVGVKHVFSIFYLNSFYFCFNYVYCCNSLSYKTGNAIFFILDILHNSAELLTSL